MRQLRSAAAVVVLCALGAPVSAQSGANVLVIANDTATGSVEIAEKYAAARSVPAAQVVRIHAPVTESIPRSDFERTIQGPIAAWLSAHGLQDQILYIVTTRGVPLRIAGTTGRAGTAASVDSELTLLYRRMIGTNIAPSGPAPNPFFLGDRPPAEARAFSHADHDIYLVTRLDGFSDEDALALIDRGQARGGAGKILLDDFPAITDPRNRWLKAAAERLGAASQRVPVEYDTTSRALTDETDVIGYYSWGVNDPALMRRHPNLTFAPGAIAGMFQSSDARTFEAPPDTWVPTKDPAGVYAGSNQSLIGDLIRAGVTGISGQVAEPLLSGSVRPDVLFPAYLAGRNLAEAFYLATPNLSWQTVVIGDPLCAPFVAAGIMTTEPPVDAETELPRYFSARRLAALVDAKLYGSSDAVRKLLIKAEARLARSDAAGAAEALGEAVKREPAALYGWRLLGQLHTAAGRYAEAAAADQRILDLDPNDIVALNNLAYHRAVREHRPADALPLATRASTLSRGVNPQIDDTLGWIHHLLGSDTEALPLLARASRALPREAEVQLHAAVVFAAVGRLDDASRALDAAATLAPALKERPEFSEVQKKIKRTPRLPGE